jgi:hypothetical protein
VSGANVNTASQLATVANGEFSFTYTPGSAPTAGHCTKFSVAYDKNSSNTVQAGEFTSTPDTIRWATTAAAASMTITAPLDNATGLALSEYDTLTTVSVTGNVKDAGSMGLAYKTLTLTGGPGVYFSSSSDGSKAATSLPVTTDANGDYAAYAFFTKSGETTITATANAASKQVKVTVNHSDEDSAQAGSNNGDDFPYKVLVDDTDGTSGDTLVVTGKVVDVFGNAVRNAEVNLSTGGSTVGALAATQVTTNQDGIWATTFVTGSNQHGDVSLKATINGQNADRKPGTAWDVTGLTLNTGKYQSTGTIKVKSFVAPFVTLSGPASKAGGGVVVLKGKAKPGVVVDVYAKTSSGLVNVDTVTTDGNGNYVADATITRSTVFVAKVTGAVSSQISVKVLSTVSLSGKALGNRWVRLSVTGKPGPGTATFWVHANGKWNKVTKATNYRGQVSWTFRTTRGWHAVKAMYQAPGTVASPVVSGRIFVR